MISGQVHHSLARHRWLSLTWMVEQQALARLKLLLVQVVLAYLFSVY